MLPIPAISIQTKILIVISVFLIGMGTGWRVCNAFNASDQLQSTNHALEVGQDLHKDSVKIVDKRDDQAEKERIVYRTIYRRINDEATDRVCFSSNSLSLWNAAITGADQYRRKPDEEAARADASGGEEASERDILTNAAENFEACRLNSIDHLALIDKVRSLQGKMCVCGGR